MLATVMAYIVLGLIILTLLGALYMFIGGIYIGEYGVAFVGLLLCLVFGLLVFGAMYDDYQIKHSTLQTDEVLLEVIDKTYTSPRTQPVHSGKMTTFVRKSAKWEITVKDDKGNCKIINDESLYSAVMVGDKVEGYRDIYTKKNGDVYKTELRFKMGVEQ